MIIKNISLENFKSYAKSSLDLEKDITIILGQNGAGKSTILEAISFALFKDHKSNITDLIRKTSDERKLSKMEVRVTFTHNKYTYEVRRGKNKSQNISKFIKRDDEKIIDIITGDTAVTKEIEDELGLDKNSFVNAVYIKQGEITDLIDKNPADRKTLISKLLNLDNLKKSYELSKEIENKYNDEYNIIQGKLANEEDVQQKIEETKKTIEKTNKILEEEIEKKNKLNKEFEEIKEEKEEQTKTKSEIDKIQINIKEINNTIENLNSSKKKNEEHLNEINTKEEENNKIEKEIRNLPKYKELKEEYDKRNNIKESLKLVEKQIMEIQTLENNLKVNEKDYLKYTKNKEKTEEITNKIKEMEEEVQNYLRLVDKNKNDTNQKDKIINEMRDIIEKTNKIFNINFKGVNEIEVAYNDTLEKKDELSEKLNSKIRECELKKQELDSNIKNTRKSLKELEQTTDKCPICQSDISHEKHEELSKEYNDNIDNFEKEKRDISKKLNENEENLSAVIKEIDQIKSIEIEVLKEKENNRKEIMDIIRKEKEEIKNKDPLITEYNNLKEESETLKKINEKLYDNYVTYISSENSLKNKDKTVYIKEKEEKEVTLKEIENKLLKIQKLIPMTDNLLHKIKHLENLKVTYDQNCGAIKEKENIINNIKEVENNLTKEKNRIYNFNTEINNLSFDEKKYDEIIEEYTLIETKVKENLNNITKYETQVKEYNNNLEERNKQLEEFKQLKTEQKQIKQMIKFIKEIRVLYGKDGIQKVMREKVRPLIQNNATNIFKDFDFDYDSIRLDEEYNIKITKGDEEFDIKLLSGGEKIVIALALRLAIAQTLSKEKSEFMILDEPTVHLDDEHKEELVDSLRSTKIASQMLIVTHDSDLMNISSNIIEVHKNNGISSFKQEN